MVQHEVVSSEISTTAKNKMDAYEGGDIKVGVDTVAAHQTSPYILFPLRINNAINLGAIENQSHNGGYNWIWNDTEAPSGITVNGTQFDGSGTYLYKSG
jgi:maltoporin